jgi:hypothetical protein
MSTPSSEPALHCLRIVYANGDVDIRHNVISVELYGSYRVIDQLVMRRKRLGKYVIVKQSTFGGCERISQVFVTPQDSFRRSIS